MSENAKSITPVPNVRLRKCRRFTSDSAGDSSATNGLHLNISPTLLSGENTQKRGRGRPKKLINQSTNSFEQQVSTSVEPSVSEKPKRGRPRKIVVPVGVESEVAASQPVVLKPRIRGRPRKVRPTEQVVVAPVPVEIEPMIDEKPKRGRPRKIVVPVEVPPVVITKPGSSPEPEDVIKRGGEKILLARSKMDARPSPQFVASGRKREMRGSKPEVSESVVEQSGWGIYNREASYLVGDFFMRRTDAIHALERENRKPWSEIEKDGNLVPVRIKVIIDQSDINAPAH